MEPPGVFSHKNVDLRVEQGRKKQNCAGGLLKLWLSGYIQYHVQGERQRWTWENVQ